jgi:uncharacterized phage-like protein YoqJ
MILGVTGHRPPRVGGYRVPNPVMTGIGDAIRADFARLAPERVLTGMALGVDQWVAWVCLEMNIPFTAVLPCEGFSTRWPSHAQDEFQHLLSLASDQILVSREVYTPGCLMQRNKWLVNNCETLYAVWNGVPDGGTYSTIRYAQRQGRIVEHARISAELWEQARVAEGRAVAPQQELIPRHSRQELLNRDYENNRRTLTETIAETVRHLGVVGDPQRTRRRAPPSDQALAQMEAMARRQQAVLARTAQINVDREFMDLLNQYPPIQEPSRQSSRAEFEEREALNRIRVEDLSERFRRAITEPNSIPPEFIDGRLPPTSAASVQKQATINTEDRTTPRRFVDIGEDD